MKAPVIDEKGIKYIPKNEASIKLPKITIENMLFGMIPFLNLVIYLLL